MSPSFCISLNTVFDCIDPKKMEPPDKKRRFAADLEMQNLAKEKKSINTKKKTPSG